MRIDSLHVTHTYGGCLEGPPEIPDMLVIMKQRLTKMWGQDRPVIVLGATPRRDVGFGSNTIDMLPKWAWMYWLDGAALNPEADGSHLFVIWFSDAGPDKGMPDPEKLLAQYEIEWSTTAKDFYY